MNDKLQELWKQAGGSFSSGNQHDWPHAKIDDPMKFAELIVRECADICTARKLTPAAFVASELREYFGVEQ